MSDVNMPNRRGPGVAVRMATTADAPSMSVALGAAFVEDPFGHWMLPDDIARFDIPKGTAWRTVASIDSTTTQWQLG